MDKILIQNWSKSNKDDLLQAIIDAIQGRVEPLEICVAGSIVFGGFNETSDIDVAVYIDSVYDFGHRYRKIIYNGIGLSLTFKDFKYFDTDLYRVLGTYVDLPRYSLMSDRYFEGNENHIKYYKGIREFLKARDGWDIPFEKYHRENKHLLE